MKKDRSGGGVTDAIKSTSLRREAMDTEGMRLLEEALRKSEANNRLLVGLLESSDQPFALGCADGHIRIVNTASERLTGFSRNELKTMTWVETLTPLEWRGTEHAKLEELPRTGQPVRYEKELLRKDGLRIPIELLVHLRKDKEGQPAFYYFFVTDRSAPKQREEELRRALERVDDAFITLDADWRFVYVNAPAERMMGARRGQLIGKINWDVFPESVGTTWERKYRRAAAGETREFEQFVEQWGRWVRVRCFPRQGGGVFVHLVDITERKRADEALQNAHGELEACVEERTKELKLALTAREAEGQRLINVLDLLPACVVLLSPDYHVRFAKGFFRERFGESQSKHCYESLFGRTEPCEGCEHYSVLSTNKPHRWEWTGPDGRNYDTFDFPFRDSDGSVLVLEMGIDITERKRAEEKVYELSGRVLRAQDEERRRVGRELHDGTAQTLTAASLNLATLNQLVDFSTHPEASEVVADINQLIDQAWQEIRNIAFLLHPPILEDAGLFAALRWYVQGFVRRTKINVDLEIERRPERFSKDVEVALFRVLQESLGNVYRHSQSPTARVRLATDSGAITLEVSDEGKGLLASAANGANGGAEELGVGISGMRERMRQLGGRLEVRSGKVGVTVRAVIPGDPVRDATTLGSRIKIVS